MTMPNISSETPARSASNTVPASASTPENTSSPAVEDFKTINEQQQQEKYEAAKQQQQQQQQHQSEPKTYANLFKSSSSSPSGFVNAAMQQQQQLQQQQSSNSSYPTSSTISTATFTQSNSTSSISYNNRNSDSSASLGRMDNNIGSASQGGPLPQRNNTRINKDFDQRRTSNSQQFGDNQQLFLGNIPHHASEEELKALFGRFGNVLELRILSKASGKLTPGVRNPLNYGFITYDDPESVQNCLANCPLYYPENSPDAQKLNVEEKKPRMRSNDMAPRQSMGGNNMNNNNMNNSQRNNMSGGPQSRSLSNSGGGGMLRGNNSNSNNMSRGGTSGGPRIGGGFNRNDNRSGPSNGGGPVQVRGGNNNAQSGGGNYGGRR